MAESKKTAEELERELKLLRDIEQVRNLSLNTEEKIDIILNRRFKKFAETKKEIAAQNESLRNSVEQYEKIEKILKNVEGRELEREKIRQDILRLENEENEENEEKISLLNDQIKELDNIATNGEKILENKKKEIQEQEKVLKSLERQKRAQDEINSVYRSFVNDIMNSQVANTIKLSGIYSNIKEQLMSIVSANQEFARTTGMIASEMVNADSVSQLNAYGVSVADLTKTTGQLAISMTSFTNQNKTVQDQLSVAASKFELLNISAAESGTTFNLLNKSLLVAGEDVGRTAELMARTAKGIGMAPAAMIKDFNAVMPQLAANGKKVFDVFYGLEKQAKSLGMAIGDLVSIAEGFDTFEGAAQKAAVLNSILGGNYLNSLELVQANEMERIELIKRGFDLSGRQFADMDRATQKSIAQTLGFKNAADAAAYFGTSTSDMRIEQIKSEASQAKLNEAMREAADIGKQLSNIYNQTVIYLKPVIETIKSAISKFTEFNDKSGGLIGTLLLVAFAFGTLLLAIIPVAMAMLGAAANIAILGGSTAVAGTGIAATITAVSTAIAGAITAIGSAASNPKIAAGIMVITVALSIFAVALGVLFAGIGLGIMLASKGMAELVSSFKGLGDQTLTVGLILLGFLAIFAIFVLGLVALMIPAAGAGTALMYLGVGIALIGAGIYLAASGMAKFVDSIKALADKKADIKEAIGIIAEIGKVMSDMDKLNSVFLSMVQNLQSLIKELQVFQTHLNTLSTDKTTTITANLKAVSDSIKLPEGNVTGFVESVNSVANVLNAASNVTTEKIKISNSFIKEVVNSSTNEVLNNNLSKNETPKIEVKVYLGNKQLSKELAKEVQVMIDGKPAAKAINGQ